MITGQKIHLVGLFPLTTDPRDAVIKKYPGLHQLGAYLHQDWPLEFRTWQDAVQQFVRRNRSDAVTAISELDEIAALNLKEEELEKLTGDLYLCYYPLPEQTHTEWVADVRLSIRRLLGSSQ